MSEHIESGHSTTIPVGFIGAATPLTFDGVRAAANHIGTDIPSLWAVVTVETSGAGFSNDRRPLILFERHVFSARTGHRFDALHADISARGPGGYGKGGSAQYSRLARAMVLDCIAALESASWGIGQLMGFNAEAIGYTGVESMVAEFCAGEDAQLLAMARFIASDSNMRRSLRGHDWAGFARRYNGPAFAKNRYDTKLAAAYARFSDNKNIPDWAARAARIVAART